MSERANWKQLAAIWVAALICYGLVAPPWLCGADNPEFVALMLHPGAAHPPGYPLYTFYLRAMSWLPFDPAPLRAAIATALLGASAVAALFAGLQRWGASPRAAAISALLVGFEVHVFAMHTHAEVFALNNLIAALIILAAAPGTSGSPLRRAAVLGLLAGLGISNHHTIVLLAPLGLWATYRAVRDAESRALTIAVAVIAGGIGLLPYLLLITSNVAECPSCLSWGRIETFADLSHHFFRSDYGTTSLGVRGEVDRLGHLIAFGTSLAKGSFLLIPVAAGYGFLAMWRGKQRGAAAAAAAAFFVCGPMFVLMFNTSTTGIGAEISARFYALAVVALSPLLAAGVNQAPRRFFPLLALFTVVLASYNATKVRSQYTGVIDEYLRDTLEPLPPDAIVFGTGDQRTFAAGYMQQVEGLRPDVDWVDARLLAYYWYVERLETRLQVKLPRSTATTIPLDEFVAEAFATGRPIVATHMFTDSLRGLPSYPLGTTVRFVPPGQRPPAPAALAKANAEFVEKMHLTKTTAELRSGWEIELLESYARPWQSLADVFEQIGDREGASHARKMAAIFE